MARRKPFGGRKKSGIPRNNQNTPTVPPSDPPGSTRSCIRRIRCQCGKTSGYKRQVKCPKCCFWQHRSCMGISDHEDVSNYKCELCEPRVVPSTEVKKQKFYFVESEDKLLDFLNKETAKIKTPFKSMTKVFKKFIEETGCGVTWITVSRSFRDEKFVKKMHELARFDDETKVRIMFATGTPVDADFLEKLKMAAIVRTDEHHRITKYQSMNLDLDGQPAFRRSIKNNISAPAPDDIEEEEDDDLEIVEDLSDDVIALPVQNIKTEPIVESPESSIAPPPPHRVHPQNYNGNQWNAQFMYQPYGAQFAQQRNAFAPIDPLHKVSNFINSLSGLMQSQATMISAATRNIEQVTPRRSSSNEGPQTSLKEFLKAIQMYILHINRMELSDISQRIGTQLRNLEIEDKLIPMSRLKLALESAFALGSSTEFNRMNSTNAKHFFQLLLLCADGKHLYEYCEQVRQKINSLDNTQIIPIDKIRVAIEAAMGIASQ